MIEYEGKKFQNASKDDVNIGSKYDQAKTKEIKKSYKEVTKWWKEIFVGGDVEYVMVQFCSFTIWVDFVRLLILKNQQALWLGQVVVMETCTIGSYM